MKSFLLTYTITDTRSLVWLFLVSLLVEHIPAAKVSHHFELVLQLMRYMIFKGISQALTSSKGRGIILGFILDIQSLIL